MLIDTWQASTKRFHKVLDYLKSHETDEKKLLSNVVKLRLERQREIKYLFFTEMKTFPLFRNGILVL